MSTPTIAHLPSDRAAINRANAEHSTGPRTPEGKDRIRLNATKHGMYAKDIVLPTEDRAAYELLGAQLLDAWNPVTEEGVRLVQLLQDTQWRIDRLTTLDFNLLALATSEHLEAIDTSYDQTTRECLAQAAAYRANARIFDQFLKHETRLRRLYDQTRAELTLHPAVPQHAEPEVGFVPNIDAKPEPDPAPQPGFVPNALTPQSAALPKRPKFAGPNKEADRKKWLRKHRAA